MDEEAPLVHNNAASQMEHKEVDLELASEILKDTVTLLPVEKELDVAKALSKARPNVQVVVTKDAIRWDTGAFALADVVGATLTETPPASYGKHGLLINAYVPRGTDKQRAYRGVYIFLDDRSRVQLWERRIQQLVLGHPLTDDDDQRPVDKHGKMLVLINPAGGKGNALKIWQNECEHVFQRSGLRLHVIVTKFAGQAQQLLAGSTGDDLNLYEYSTVTFVSGDGLVYEGVHGIMERKDWVEVLKHIRIGHIPGGSGNGLAKSLLHTAGEAYGGTNAAFLSVKQNTRRVDMYTVQQDNEPLRYGFLCLGWALISDIDFESEKWRKCCGSARFDWTAFLRICCLRTYNAKVSYIPTHDPMDHSHLTACTKSPCATCDAPQKLDPYKELAAYRYRYQYPPTDEKAPNDLVDIISRQHADQKAEVDNNEWVEDTDDFIFTWALNLPWVAPDLYAAPYTHLSGGCIDVLTVSNAGRCSLLAGFADMETGQHVKHDSMTYVKCKAFRLRPHSARQSIFSLDGEPIPYKELEIRCFRGILRVAGR